jgi:hypothetical protein
MQNSYLSVNSNNNNNQNNQNNHMSQSMNSSTIQLPFNC